MPFRLTIRNRVFVSKMSIFEGTFFVFKFFFQIFFELQNMYRNSSKSLPSILNFSNFSKIFLVSLEILTIPGTQNANIEDVSKRLQSLQDCSRTKTAVAPRLQSLQDCSRSKTAVAPRLQSLQDCSCSKTTVAPRLQSLQDYSPCKTVVAIQCPHFGYRGWIFKRIIKRTRIISSFCDYENLPTKTGTKIAF